MPNHAEQQLLDVYRELDWRIADKDRAGAQACCDRLREVSGQSTRELGPSWLSSMVKSKGIRLPYLERALEADTVVVTGDASLKHSLIDALQGKKPFVIDRVSIELRITW